MLFPRTKFEILKFKKLNRQNQTIEFKKRLNHSSDGNLQFNLGIQDLMNLKSPSQ